MSREDRSFDALAMAALLVGLALSAGLLAENLLLWRTGSWLPANPAEFARAFGKTARTGAPLLMTLGTVFFVLQLLDMARFHRLRARRVILRLSALAALLSLATLAGSQFAPVADQLATGLAGDGLAWRARLDSLEPAFWVHRVLSVAIGVLTVAAHRAPLPAPAPARPDGRYASSFIPPVFGETPALTQRQWRVLALMVGASFFNAYDNALFSLALKQIQADLAIAEGSLGQLGSVIRLGVLPGLALIVAADTLGRRAVLLWTIVGYTVCTAATAFAPDATTLVVLQLLARAFGVVEGVLAAVVVSEEIDPEHRGWALGLLGALAGLGIGLAWLLFSQVDALPLGWRSLYLVGVAPLLALTWLRRSLPETERFERYRERRGIRMPIRAGLRPLAALLRAYPGRFAAVSAVVFLMSFSGQAAGFFGPKFVQDTYGWSPAQFALLGAGLGALALCLTPLVGRLGDRRGRRPVTLFFVVANPLTVIAVFNAGMVVVLVPALVCMLLSDIGSDTNLDVFAKELFPTSHRATADGARLAIGQLGGSLGLALESVLYGWLGSHASAISLLAVAGLAVPFIVARHYPETAGRALESVSPER